MTSICCSYTFIPHASIQSLNARATSIPEWSMGGASATAETMLNSKHLLKSWSSEDQGPHLLHLPSAHPDVRSAAPVQPVEDEL
ncbi:hypothetical protein QE152_g24377 [Popillia japonica]|uniref:Uncharacterized protein n=1 Tax=Popillia japonica TaxID=7064 RepID=A0AAW1KBM8_POPJA